MISGRLNAPSGCRFVSSGRKELPPSVVECERSLQKGECESMPPKVAEGLIAAKSLWLPAGAAADALIAAG